MLKKKTACEYFERNLEECCDFIRSVKLSHLLPNSKPVLEFFGNYRCGYGLNDLAFFLTSLTGVAHFGYGSSTYCATTNSSTKPGLFLVLIGASGMLLKNNFLVRLYLLKIKSFDEMSYVVFLLQLKL